jgi:hypothetical protein
MEIYKTSNWLKLNELYEDSKGITIPYFVERLEIDKEVIWFGLETNWKMKNGVWYILYKGSWKESDEPKYEEIYLKLNKK